MKSHQFMHTCILCKTEEIQASLCSLFMGAPIIGPPPAAAQPAVCVYGNKVFVNKKYGVVIAPYAHCWVIFHACHVF